MRISDWSSDVCSSDLADCWIEIQNDGEIGPQARHGNIIKAIDQLKVQPPRVVLETDGCRVKTIGNNNLAGIDGWNNLLAHMLRPRSGKQHQLRYVAHFNSGLIQQDFADLLAYGCATRLACHDDFQPQSAQKRLDVVQASAFSGAIASVDNNHQALVHVRFTLGRSEEQTSELQSLIRSSYAVFSLKTKP